MTFKRTQCVTADVSLVTWNAVSCKLKSFLNISAITSNVRVFSCTIRSGTEQLRTLVPYKQLWQSINRNSGQHCHSQC